jgi:proline dehydrogenase
MTDLNFSNLENAFASKSNADLNRAYWLFKVINNNFLVKVGPPVTNLLLKLHVPIKSLIRATLYKHFCGGENIDDCYLTIKHLAEFGVGSILDYSVEGKESENDFDFTCNEIIKTINRAKGDKAIPFCVFKPTGVARIALLEKVSERKNLSQSESEEFARVKQRITKICKTAFENDVRLFIDAEESWIQQAIDDMAEELMQQFNKQKPVVFNTIQLYRHDRLTFLKKSFAHAQANNYFSGYKLVRGAYMEKERARAQKMNYASPIQTDKESCDNDYNEALKFCIANIDRTGICAGTHNEQSNLLLAQMMEEKNIARNNPHIWFSQLLGMSDHISFNLAKAGYNVCKYVPYGPVAAVLPYLFRRASENTSIAGQMGRELSLIIEEKKRRRN